MKKCENVMQVIDDTRTKKEWGCNPIYKDLDSILNDYLGEIQTRPEFFGIEKE